MEKQTREQGLEWVASLKPGDKVIFMNGADNPTAILTVKKVTPSGIVRTEANQSFKQVGYCAWFYVGGYGGTYGKIVPYEDELAAKAMKYQAQHKKAQEDAATINKAKSLCYNVAYGKPSITLEQAKAIISLLDRT